MTTPWADVEHKRDVRERAEMLAKIPDGLMAKAELLAVVGSTAHGISVSTEGASGDDLDVSGFYVPPREQVLGLMEANPLTFRTAAKDAPSQAGDVDLVLHPLRKFLRQAFKGNPTILAMLYSPDTPRLTSVGEELRGSRGMFASKSAGYAFKGYAENQYQRLRGERGRMSVNRTDLVEAHGYDTKYAAHVLRLCEQGIVLMEDGYMPMPLRGPVRDEIREVRLGGASLDDVLEMIAAARERLAQAVEKTSLPVLPDQATVDALAVRLHRVAWKM